MDVRRERVRQSDMRRFRYRRCLKLCGLAAVAFVLTSLGSLSTLSSPVVTPQLSGATNAIETRHSLQEATRSAAEPGYFVLEEHRQFLHKNLTGAEVQSSRIHPKNLDKKGAAPREIHLSRYKTPKRKFNTSFETLSAVKLMIPIGGEKKPKGPQLFTQADCDKWIKSQRTSLLQSQGEQRYFFAVNKNTPYIALTNTTATNINIDDVNNNTAARAEKKNSKYRDPNHQSTFHRNPPLPYLPLKLRPHPAGRPPRPKVTVVILVVSSPNHVQHRQAIRATWGWEPPEGVEVIFLLGADPRWDNITAREQHLHKDVVRVAVRDTYRGLPRKVLAGLRWLQAKRPGRTYYVKCDDDVYVHVPALLALLQEGVHEGEVVGALAAHSLVIRDPQHKWYVSPKDFPCPLFPPYVLGGAYAMAGGTLGRLLRASQAWQGGVPVEDVLVTGLLAWRAGVKPVDHSGFPVYWLQPRPSSSDLIAGRKVVCINVAPTDILQLDREIQAYYRQLFQNNRTTTT